MLALVILYLLAAIGISAGFLALGTRWARLSGTTWTRLLVVAAVAWLLTLAADGLVQTVAAAVPEEDPFRRLLAREPPPLLSRKPVIGLARLAVGLGVMLIVIS